MLGSDAVAQVQQICGWRSDRAAEILAALQFAQVEREKPGLTFPWWLLASSNLVFTINDPVVLVPTNFIQEAEPTLNGDVVYVSGTGLSTKVRFLTKMDFKTATQSFYGAVLTPSELQDSSLRRTGAPEVFSLSGQYFVVFPIPDQAYSVLWNYWGADTPISLNTTNKWLTNAPWVLIGDAAKKIGADLGNANAVSTASTILSTAESNMFRASIHRQEAGLSRRMGSRL